MYDALAAGAGVQAPKVGTTCPIIRGKRQAGGLKTSRLLHTDWQHPGRLSFDY